MFMTGQPIRVSRQFAFILSQRSRTVLCSVSYYYISFGIFGEELSNHIFVILQDTLKGYVCIGGGSAGAGGPTEAYTLHLHSG